jgi:hypothetical protein
MRWYWWLVIVLLVLAGISTVVPTEASKECYLGYQAHCSFTPISTGMCIGCAVAVMFIGGMTNKKTREKLRDWADETDDEE